MSDELDELNQETGENLPSDAEPQPQTQRRRGRPKGSGSGASAGARSSAERQRAYRERKRAAGASTVNGTDLGTLERDLAEVLGGIGMLTSVLLPVTGTTMMLRAESSAALAAKMAPTHPRLLAACLRLISLVREGEALSLAGSHVAALAVDTHIVSGDNRMVGMMVGDVLTVMQMTPDEQAQYAEIEKSDDPSAKSLFLSRVQQRIAQDRAVAAQQGQAA